MFSFSTRILLTALFATMGSVACAQQLPEGGKRTGAFAVDTTTPIEEVKAKAGRYLAAQKPRFMVEDYARILDELADSSRYVVTNGRDFAKTVAPDKIVVYLRHDEDGDPWTALRMVEEEQKRGLKSTVYIRPTTPYYGNQEPHRVVRYASMDPLYRQIMEAGADIGVHTDLLDMKVRMDIDPLIFQKEELAYWHAQGFPVVGSVSNGSAFLRKMKVNNTWMFSEFGKKGEVEYRGKRYSYGTIPLADFGFAYEGYRNSQNKRMGDITTHDTDKFIETLRSFKPGDRVSFLTHPMHWRSDKPVTPPQN